MGGRGPKGRFQFARHIHYQIHDENGTKVDPEAYWATDTPEAIVPDRFTQPYAFCNSHDNVIPPGAYKGGPYFDEFTLLTGDNVVYSGAGPDIITTGNGRDTLAGGPGDDYLEGGRNNDLYIYNPHDGNDTIVEANHPLPHPNEDTLRFGGCITPRDITTYLIRNNLVIRFKDSPDDSITVVDWKRNLRRDDENRATWRPFLRRIEYFEFFDGTRLNAKQFTKNMVRLERDTSMSHPPVMVSDLADDPVQIAEGFPKEGAVFSDEKSQVSAEKMNCLIQDMTAFAPDGGVFSSNNNDAAANACPFNIVVSDIASDWRQCA